MSDTAPYEAFAAAHPPDSVVPVTLVEKTATGFDVKVAGTDLKGTVPSAEIALDGDDIELATKYAEPGEQMRGFVVRVDAPQERISFTLIDPAADPWRAHETELYEGATLTGKVLDHGVRGYDVELFEGVVALLPNDEVSWEAGLSFKEEEQIDVVVTRIDGHAMEVSARRTTARPTNRFDRTLVEQWERALPPDAALVDELRFRAKLASDLRTTGVAMDVTADENRSPETLVVHRDDVAGTVSLFAIEHGELSEPARGALAVGSMSFKDANGPEALPPRERDAAARVLAMLGALEALPWPLTAWASDDKTAPTETELNALAQETEVRTLHEEGRRMGRVDGRIVAVVEITRFPD